MATYVLSDIHGEIDRYYAMLKLIQFSDSDTLYVLGDVIDRGGSNGGKAGVDMLLDIIGRPNVHMIIGNHEQLLLNDLCYHEGPEAKRLWHMNGGADTRRDLVYRRPENRGKIVSFLRALPSRLDIEVNGRKFHLVHGYPADNKYDRIWNRPEVGTPPPFDDRTVIVGHTPTCFLNGPDITPQRIWHGNGIVCIDCGCGNMQSESRRLACLRLEDMQEFYI